MHLLLWSLIGSFIASLVGKILADAFLGAPINLIGQSIRLEYALNPGIAFGLQLPSFLQPILIFVAVVILVWVAIRSRHTNVSSIGFGLLLGGALGNIVDRSFDGLVTDFVRIGWFPIFNIADSAISIGVALLLIEALWTEVHGRIQRSRVTVV